MKGNVSINNNSQLKVSIPYRFNESICKKCLRVKRHEFQFLIGSMKEKNGSKKRLQNSVSIPYRFNERLKNVIDEQIELSFNSL